jgi:peroxiredoxin (alkyl hydroperoxide reductase subunit C)
MSDTIPWKRIRKTIGRKNMKTVGQKLPSFTMVGVTPENEFFNINNDTYKNTWKVIVWYPKDFTFVCPTEIVAYDKLNKEFENRGAKLLIGSRDNEYVKVAWKAVDEQLSKLTTTMFADQANSEWDEDTDEYKGGLAEQLGILTDSGVALRATIIVDQSDVIQHITVNNLNVGRNANETLRILDALQTGEKTACDRPIGGSTLG